MPTLGEELKRRREERGKTLSTISENTRIGIRFLKAIEDDNFSVLPGGIFTRSFIRAYAREVGMDESEATVIYHQQISPEEAPPEASPPGPEPATQSEGSVADHKTSPIPTAARIQDAAAFASRINWPTVAIVFAILFLGGVMVFLITQWMNGDAGSDTQAGATAPAGQSRPAPRGGAAPAASQPGGLLPGDSVISVSVEATGGDSWVGYQVDDGQGGQLLLKQGESKSLPEAHNKVKLNIGNRKALTIKINNHDVTFPPDVPNFSAHVIISRDNLQSYLQTNGTHAF